MSDAEDSDEEDEAPPIELGEGPDVEGAPLGRIAARFQWGIEKSAIEAREGDTDVRTPDGPRKLGELLAEVDTTYFSSRHGFVRSVCDVVGTGPVPTADE